MQAELPDKDYYIVFELARQVLDGAVFKQAKKIEHLNVDLLKTISRVVYIQTAGACSRMAIHQPQLIDNLLRKVVPKSAAFISIVAYELIKNETDPANLIDAATIMGLSQIVDHLMDRGDEKMLIALDYYFDDEATTDPDLLARIAMVEHSVMFSKRVATDDADIVTKTGLDVLHDEAAMLRSSNEYKTLDNTFWKDVFFRRNAEQIARLSIGNVGLRPATYLVYLSYIHAGYNAPPLAEILDSNEIMHLIRLGEWAIRLWDDWGDREIDAGRDIYTNAFAINLFLERNEYLAEAYLRDIVDTPYYERARNIILEGSDGLNYIIIGILREHFAVIKQDIDEKYLLFIELLERIIEAGFVNVAGDEAISAVKEVVADYSDAR